MALIRRLARAAGNLMPRLVGRRRGAATAAGQASLPGGAPEPGGDTAPGLKRSLGAFELTATGVGLIVGAGIFVLIGIAAGMAGGALWLPFLLAALAAALTGLSYAELASTFPSAGASFEYARRAFGANPAFMVGWLMVFGNIVSASAVALGFAGYLSSFVLMALVPVAVALICLSGVILLMGVRESVALGVVFTIIEVLALVIAIVVAARFIGEVNYLEMPQGIGGVLQATTLVFFAYLGFEQIASLSEEAKNPTRAVPVAILLAVVVTTALYVAVAVVGVSALGWEELSRSNAPLADVVRRATGARVGAVVAVMALFATANTVLFLLLTSSRLMYGMAASGSLPRLMGAVHSKRRTPWVATLVAVVVAAVFALLGDIEAIAQLSNFAILTAFLVVNAALIRLRYTRPDLARPFRTPWSVGRMPVIPVLGIGTSLFMLAQIELRVLGYGLGIALLGLVVSLLVPWGGGWGWVRMGRTSE